MEQVPWSWRKTARKLHKSIAEGCPMCYYLRHRFEVGYLRSALYDSTGDVDLEMYYLDIGEGQRPMLGIGLVDGSPGHDWLSYKIAAVSGKSFRLQNCLMNIHDFDILNACTSRQ